MNTFYLDKNSKALKMFFFKSIIDFITRENNQRINCKM